MTTKFKPILINIYPVCPNCKIGRLRYSYSTPLDDGSGYDTINHDIHTCTACMSEY